jgi:hypothetical protein
MHDFARRIRIVGMKVQFGTKALLLTTAFVSIYLAGVTAGLNMLRRPGTGAPWDDLMFDVVRPLLFFMPFWVPLIFIAYAVGRRAISPGIVLALAVGEATAICAMLFVLNSR